ncbi:MAG TPA: universal stress protein [Steroidobacteraceae bacterium]|nr:universal stress protein [Steroidobacteraceae bacterium]
MSSLQRILATTDFSTPAEHAVARAATLARDQGAALTLLHVVERELFETLHALVGAVDQRIESRVLDEVRTKLAAFGQRIGEQDGVEVTTELRCGVVAAEIAEYAQAMAADLIVLGAWGAGFIRQFVPGSTAARAIRKSQRPLLATKQQGHRPYRRVLIPVDFSPWSAGAVHIARAVAPDAELLLLHAFTVPFEGLLFLAGVADDALDDYRVAAKNEAIAQLRQFTEDAGLRGPRTSTLAKLGEPVPVILDQEQEFGCDLIVLGKHGRSVTEELLLGSVTSHIVAQSNCDVLVASRETGP